MSAEPHKYWPSVGSTYRHWSDLLLATQLAAARAGFNYVGRSWDARVPLQFAVQCNVELKGVAVGCRAWLLTARAVDEDDPSGPWRVSEVFASRFAAQRHPEHSRGVGLSSWLKVRLALQDLNPHVLTRSSCRTNPSRAAASIPATRSPASASSTPLRARSSPTRAGTGAS